MNRDESIKILGIIRAAYPSFHKGSGEGDIAAAVDVWQMMFESEPFQMVQMAIKAFIATDTKGFSPSIGAIKEQLAKLQAGDEGEMTEQEAWTLVSGALRNGIYGYEKEFAKLPETIQRCIGSPMMLHEWAQMDIGELNTVVSSNFMRSYRARASHVRELEKLPPDVKALFGAVGEAMKLPEARKPEAQKLEPGEPVAPPDWWAQARKDFEAATKAQVEAVKKQMGTLFGGMQQ